MNNREATPETEFVMEPTQLKIVVIAYKMNLMITHIPSIIIYDIQFQNNQLDHRKEATIKNLYTYFVTTRHKLWNIGESIIEQVENLSHLQD